MFYKEYQDDRAPDKISRKEVQKNTIKKRVFENNGVFKKRWKAFLCLVLISSIFKSHYQGR